MHNKQMQKNCKKILIRELIYQEGGQLSNQKGFKIKTHYYLLNKMKVKNLLIFSLMALIILLIKNRLCKTIQKNKKYQNKI